jgi:hypothetical protein
MTFRSVHALMDALSSPMISRLRAKVGPELRDDWRTLSEEEFKNLYIRFCHAYRREVPGLLEAYPFLRDGVKEHDRRVVDTPFEWQYWPLLPMTLRDGAGDDPNHNVVLFSDNRPVVYFETYSGMCNIARNIHAATWQMVLARCKTRTFPDMDALVEVYTVD